MRKQIMIVVSVALFTVIGGLALSAQGDSNPAEDAPLAPDSVRDDIAVTVYNQGSALIRDTRTFELQEGLNRVDFTGVASSIDATSVNFRSVTDPTGTIVLEQNYVYDLVNDSALLERYLDETIEVTMMALDGGNNTFRGQLLSARNGLIIQLESGEIVSLRGQVQDIRFPDLPAGLVTRPTLRWLLQSAITGPQQVELTYLTSGISWTADYNIVLSDGNAALDLNGWVTLNNRSGATYENAQLKLVAGDVNRIQPEMRGGGPMAEADVAMAAPPTPGVEQRELFEYQLYEVNRRVTIADNETKQVEFVSGADVPANTYYVYDARMPFYGYGGPIIDRGYGQTGATTVQTWLEFSTAEDGGLGADLPAGRIRVYQEDIDGAALLIGENRIDHTPQGEAIELLLGNAFDLVGERVQTDFNMISNNVIEETFEIRVRNRKDDETVTVRVPELLYRWSNWEIIASSQPFEQLNSNSIQFEAEVAPGEETVITYTVRYSWPR